MYRLSFPAPLLAAYIENYWTVTREGDEVVDLRVEVYVDARADLVFNFGASYSRTPFGRQGVSLNHSNLDAQRTYPIVIEQAGDVAITGVRFRLGGLAPFLRSAAAGLTDRVVPVEEAFGPAVVSLERALRARAGNPDESKELLDQFFLSLWRPDPGRDQVAAAVNLFAGTAEGAHSPQPSAAEVAGRLSVTPRTLARLFHRYVGLSPKYCAQVLRFQNALRLLMRESRTGLAEVAAACGYYDQAHLVRDFHRFAGGVPKQYKGYYPDEGPEDFAPNVVRFFQDPTERHP